MSEISHEAARIRLLRRAARRVIVTQLASERSLARWFDISEERAGALLADLERVGVVGPPDLGTSRQVLHSADLGRAGEVVDYLIPRPK